MLDDEHVEDLKRSKKLTGEIYPVVYGKYPDGHKELAGGTHRLKAGWQAEQVVEVSNKLDFLQLKFALTTQRRSSQQEQIEMIAQLCQELEKTHKYPKHKIGKHVVKLVPLNRQYVYELIPNQYKQQKRPGKRPRKPKEIHGIEEIDGSTVKEVEEGEAEPERPSEARFTCGRCGTVNIVDPKTWKVLLIE